MNSRFKRMLSVVMAVIMMLSLLAVAPSASSDVVKLVTNSTSYKQGDKFLVSVKFDKPFNSAAAFDVGVKYDPQMLEVKDSEDGPAITNARNGQSDGVYSKSQSTPGMVRWVFAGTKNYSFSGVFATIEFIVDSRTTSGKTSIEFVVNDATSNTHNDVSASITSSPLNLTIERSAESDMHFKETADGTAYIVTAYGAEDDRDVVEIPAVHYGLPVIGIGNGAFTNRSEIKEIKFASPSSIEKIDANAFIGCDKLETINIPDAVTVIGANAFDGCTSLKNIHFPYLLQKIEEEAFIGCTALETVNLPFCLTDIGENAFKDCTSLKSIYISKNTKNIDNTAFSGIASEKTIYTVDGNSVIDSYNTESGLGAVISKTVNDISLGKATPVTSPAPLKNDGAKTDITVELDDGNTVELDKDYEVVYLNNYKEGDAKAIVAGINGYGEGYVVDFTVVCNHDWEKSVGKAPNCTVEGYSNLKCRICGKTDKEPINPLGHYSPEWIVDKLPTITTTGLQHKNCIRCKVDFDKGTIIDKVVPDADGNGNVNSSDALIVLQYTVDLDVAMTNTVLKQVDCNGDGKVNSIDALTILRITVGDIVL